MDAVVGCHLHHLVEGGVGDAQAHQQTLVHVYHLLNIIIIYLIPFQTDVSFKGTVSRDFLLQVFFLIHFPPIP
jgi:hypothetical protein